MLRAGLAQTTFRKPLPDVLAQSLNGRARWLGRAVRGEAKLLIEGRSSRGYVCWRSGGCLVASNRGRTAEDVMKCSGIVDVGFT